MPIEAQGCLDCKDPIKELYKDGKNKNREIFWKLFTEIETEHIKKHGYGKRKHLCAGEDCAKMFKTSSKRNNHQITVHSKERPRIPKT